MHPRRMIPVAAMLVLAMATVATNAADVHVMVHMRRVVSEAEIEREFVERSTPGSATFRQHLTLSQLTTLVRADPETAAIVSATLREASLESVAMAVTQDIVSGRVSAGSSAAAWLQVPDAMFTTGHAKRMLLPIPSALKQHVVRIVAFPTGATDVLQKRPRTTRGAKRVRKTPALTEPGATQTPATLRARYNVPSEPLPSTAVQGVAEFQNSFFNATWIKTFNARYNISSPAILVKGPNSVSSDDQEGVLDLEYISAMAPGANTWWISNNDTSSNPNGIDFAWWCLEVAKLSPMPTVVSISWGMGEAEYYLKADLMVSDNDAFRKLGLMGVSVMVASGDAGPGGRNYISCNHFDPSWPASSAYVTAVGATYQDPANGTEIAVKWSGGGFSDYFPRPAWQQEAVQQYLNTSKTLPNATFYNASGRAFPDVATLGTNFQVYGDSDGYGYVDWYLISGTSCASPTFAGIITRLNAARAAKGKPSLGFLNPALYKMGTIGYDVVDGYNLDTDCFMFPFGGFVTAKGWDPVTGLGTPDYKLLLAALMQD